MDEGDPLLEALKRAVMKTKMRGPKGAFEDEDMLRAFGKGNALTDRALEGQLMGPVAAVPLGAAYEGVAKPIIENLPESINKMLPTDYQQTPNSSPSWLKDPKAAARRYAALLAGSTGVEGMDLVTRFLGR